MEIVPPHAEACDVCAGDKDRPRPKPENDGPPERLFAGSAEPATPNSCRTWGSNEISAPDAARSSCPASRIRPDQLLGRALRGKLGRGAEPGITRTLVWMVSQRVRNLSEAACFA